MADVFETVKQQFLEQIDGLLKRDVNRLSRFGQISFDDAPYRVDTVQFADLCSKFVTVETRSIDYAAFDAWYTAIDYRTRFPAYIGTYSDEKLLEKKAFEHWLSLQETVEAPGGAFLDVGCATSPFSDLVRQQHDDICDICYRVDLPIPEYGYKPGVHGNVIGCSAAEIPLPDGAAARIYSHNAIEHFEDGLYFGFFREAARLLKPNGVIYICPLFHAKKTFAYVSLTGIYRRLSFPNLSLGMEMVYSELIGQPYELQIDAEDLKNKIIRPLAKTVEFAVIRYDNAAERHYGVDVALRGVRL